MSTQYFKYPELLSPPIKRAAYSDRTAWFMAEMASLAYLKFEKDEKELLIEELKKVDFKLMQIFNSQETQAFLALRDRNKMAILAFRGTEKEKLEDIISDLDARFYKDEMGVNIHKGFNKAFQCVEADIKKSLSAIADCTLYVTGHSLGGAIALIATRALNGDNLAACYTFGSPKVGSSEFSDTIKPPIYRIVNNLDPVPFLPFTYLCEFMYYIARKIKNEKLLKYAQALRGYVHHGYVHFLPPCASDYKDVRVVTDCNDLIRFLIYFTGRLTKRKDIASDHAIDLYCEKLAQYALKRLADE